jgi:hypothetical protein
MGNTVICVYMVFIAIIVKMAFLMCTNIFNCGALFQHRQICYFKINTGYEN